MPRVYVKKLLKHDETTIQSALKEIREGEKINTIAKKYNIPRGTLRGRIEKETSLKKYFLKAAAIFHGFSYTAARQLAYEYAVSLKSKGQISYIPPSWKGTVSGQKGSASKDWMLSFMRRHPDLSLRKPQATSLGRATAFNEHNVSMFFTKLKDVIERFNINPENIWNMDETALTTVQKPVAVIAQRGVRNIGSITSAERGVLVTLALAVSATGVYHFLTSAGFGADGAANASGWMQAEQFTKFLVHFKRFAHPSVEVPVLLILDNHESHLTIAGLDFCKENGIIVLSLPPHTSHKLQPLDKGVFGPIKRHFNAACDNWMRLPMNAAKTITMHDIPGIAQEPIQKGASILNIQAGFRVTGIFPLNDSIFTEEDFLPSEVTNRSPEDSLPVTDEVPNVEQEMANHVETEDQENDVVNLDSLIENVRPFPKAAPRKISNRGRKRRKCAILTDSEEMEALRLEQETAAQNKLRKTKASSERVKRKILREANKSKTSQASSSDTKRGRGRPRKTDC
ncbi:uncharacterized protein LOC122497871 [Leptopilina heterotoma]|uniref:uncharacterized protein LOC122497871 n=1 Tax=Leptopilina heterotoma TaxID=63436 RepID=UPI001CA83D10|nr:uncharacterized protein LOC122497871 [Leptopilina heterotoma]